MNIISKVGQRDNVVTYEHICDTRADMSKIEPRYITLGSTCIVLAGESGMEVYMADSTHEWHDLLVSSNSGTPSGLSIHICGEDEVEDGVPSVEFPLETELYLVPAREENGNLYDEYVYVNGEWELFGGAPVNLGGYATQEWVSQQGYLTSFTETDPTVPAWAKAATKPAYTAAEVGAPTTQEMSNAIATAIGNIHSFDVQVVQTLPSSDIETHTIYFVPKTGTTNDIYDEYLYINNQWEMIGNTQIDLSSYALTSEIPTKEFTAFYGLASAAGDTTQAQSSNALGNYTSSAKAAIKQMLGITNTITVTAVTQDGVTVTGQTVTVRANSTNGEVYATAAYEGQPVSFSVPDGFSYYISISDTLASHFNPTTASGIVSNANVAVTLQYSDISNIQTARDIKAALNAGIDLTELVGEQITCTKGTDTLTWDVVDYDAANKNVKLLLHDCFGSANMVFEPAQALMWCENGLAAGSYTFKDGNTSYYFTTTTAIPAEGQLRATNTAFYTYQSQSATGTLETGTVSTDEITGATDLGTCGQGLLNVFGRNKYGSNNIAESAIQWWLNSDVAANTFRPFITKFQRAHSYNIPGFMYELDQDFTDCLDEVEWKCSTNNVYECPKSLGGLTDGAGRAYTLKAKFCLASEMEIFGSYGGTQDGSTIFDLYSGASADDKKKYRGTTAQTWWLRSPYWSTAYRERTVHSSGGASSNDANYSCAPVPACQISHDEEVTS